VINEIQELFIKGGSRSLEALQMVDRLARAALEGHHAFCQAHALLLTELGRLQVDAKNLKYALEPALRLLAVCDGFNGTKTLVGSVRIIQALVQAEPQAEPHGTDEL
jgi:hypothetical protein